ncbi:hypothetical protein AFNJKBDN_CDS0019 [Halorubrum virus V_ICIS4]|nr:hypothetical protein AFNJKBDN_CDS0019 [Halorubrum virus V_ICIS4]
MSDGSDADEKGASEALRDLTVEGVEEDGVLRTLPTLAFVAVIAFIILVPEYLRMAACKLVGKEYRSPTQRLVESVEYESE